MNLAIIEDDPELKEEILDYFKDNERINIVLAVPSVPKFLTYYRNFLNIDIILLDINLPNVSGIDGIPAIRNLLPEVEIIMHTVINDYDTIFKCICSGANGYLLKNGNLKELENTLNSIDDGTGCALSPSVARRILSYFQPRFPSPNNILLTEQELIVSRLLVDGMSYQQIADNMNITINGVRYHVKNIYKKLHIKSKGALLKRYREGTIDLSNP